MTAVAPRSASVPPAPAPAPAPTSVAVDRAPVPGPGSKGPSDFEAVLRGRTSRRAAPATSARGDDRRQDAAAGSASTADPAPGVVSAVTPPVPVAIPAAPSPGDPAAPAAKGAPSLVTPGAAAPLGDNALSVPPGPRVSASAIVHPVPAVHPQLDAPGAPGAVEQAPPRTGAAAAPTVTASPTRLMDRGRDGRQGDAAGESAPASAASTPTDSPAYPLATPVGAPVGVGTPVAAPSDSRPAQATVPPQAQVLNAMSPVVTTADGTHRLTVHLAPAHLGSVRVHVEVTGGEVTVRLTAADPATGDALRQGAAELRSHLEGLGLRSGGIEVQVASGDPARDLLGGTPADSATPDRDDPGQHDSDPWSGAQTAAGHGDGPPDGGWRRHELPLDGWAPRHADGPRPGGRPLVTAPDSHRPPTHDVRVDVRM